MLTEGVKIFSKKKNIIIGLLVSAIIFVILRVIPVYMILKTTFIIPGVKWSRKYELFTDYVLTSFFEIAFVEQLLIILLALATAVNMIVFYYYIKRQQKILSGKSFFASASGMFLGIFGIGCLSCGVLVVAPIVSALGLGAYIAGITQYALLLSYVGLTFIIFSIGYLLHQLSKPLVC